MSKIRSAALLLVVALAGTACGGDPEPVATPAFTETATEIPTPTPTPTPEPEPTTETPTPEPTEREIDVAYVDEFMDKANVLRAEALEQVRQAGSPDSPEAMAIYDQFATDAFLTFDLAGFEQVGGVDILASPVGVATSSTREVLVADEDCILATIDFDPSATYTPEFGGPTGDAPWHIRLAPGPTNDAMDLPWRLVGLIRFPAESSPTTCAAFDEAAA